MPFIDVSMFFQDRFFSSGVGGLKILPNEFEEIQSGDD
jgi:hypothetical protein